jgi:uncharacterized protein YndB with AHSA1/START domain
VIANPSATTLTTPSDQEIVVTRVVAAPRRLVFEAYTSPEHVPHWMLGPQGWSMPVCRIDLRPGGVWHFVWRHADGSEMEIRGVYREIVPPDRLVCTQSWGDGWPDTTNTLLLAEEHGRTTITQRLLFVSKQARDAALRTGMHAGMSETFDRLSAYLQVVVKEAVRGLEA